MISSRPSYEILSTLSSPPKQKYQDFDTENKELAAFIAQAEPGMVYTIKGYKHPHAIVRDSRAYGKKIYFVNLFYPYYQGALSAIYAIEMTFILFNKTVQVKDTHELLKFCYTSNSFDEILATAIKEFKITNINAEYLKMRYPLRISINENDTAIVLRMNNLKDPQTNEGSDLLAYIRQTHKKPYLHLSDFIFSLQRAIYICEDFIQLHNKGYVHADLKEANIFIVGGKTYVIDFGFTKRIGDKDEVRGSPLYLSPTRLQAAMEQRRNLKAANCSSQIVLHTYEAKDDDAGLAKTLSNLLLGKSKVSSGIENDIVLLSEDAKDPLLYTYKKLYKLHFKNFRDYRNPYRLREDWYERICANLDKLKQSEIELPALLKNFNELLAEANALSDQLILYANDVLECIQQVFWIVDARHVLGKRVAAQAKHNSFNDLIEAEKFLLEMHLACKHKYQKEVAKPDVPTLTKILNMVGIFNTLLCGGEIQPSHAQIQGFLQLIGNEENWLGRDYFQACSDRLQEYVRDIPALQRSYSFTPVQREPSKSSYK